MYNEQLDALIDAALADGMISEKERAVLRRKAEAMGVDADELDMVLDARLHKMRQNAPKTESNKMGDIKKCPKCGAVVQSYQATCPDCHYEFENLEANKSIERLFTLLREVDDAAEDIEDESVFQKKKSIIQNFPVPNTKADIVEFITALYPKATNVEDRLAKSYFVKYKECLLKVKFLFPDDTAMTSLLKDDKELDKIEKQLSEKPRTVQKKVVQIVNNSGSNNNSNNSCPPPSYSYDVPQQKKGWNKLSRGGKIVLCGCGIPLIIFIIIIIIGSILVSVEKKEDAKRLNEITALVNKGDITTAAAMAKNAQDNKVVYSFYMKQGVKQDSYKLAENYIPYEKDATLGDSASLYYNWLQGAVDVLCNAGRTKDARALIDAKIVFFEDFNNSSDKDKWGTEAVSGRLKSFVNEKEKSKKK